jgi:hypothetical protein
LYCQLNSSERDKKFTDKLFYGGAIGLSIGDVSQVDIVPIAGIWIIPQWSLGVGGRYSYYSHRGYFIGGPSQTYRSHIWGTSAFTQVLPIPDLSEVTPIQIHGGLIFHAEIEWLYIDRRMINPFVTDGETGKTWINLYLIGLGYRQRIGERAAFNILLLWNVKKDTYSPYISNPMIRVNFTL